jgi:hypothetical protein
MCLCFSFCDSMWSLWMEASKCVQVYYRLFIYLLLLEIQLSRVESLNSIPFGLTLPNVCPYPKPWLRFPKLYVGSCVCVVGELVWEVIVRFVDIDGIVDNHCLIVHFIKITIIIMKTYVSYSVHMTYFLNNIHRVRSLECNII